MESTDTMPLVKLGILPRSGHEITLGDIAVIDDNMDMPAVHRADRPGTVFPIKFLINFVIYCTEGGITLTLNNKEYDLHANECLFCTQGLIVEDISWTEDFKVVVLCGAQDFLGKSPTKAVEIIRKWMLYMKDPAIIRFSDEITDALTNGYRHFRELHRLTVPELKDEVTINFLHLGIVMLSSWISSHGLDQQQIAMPRKREIAMKFLNDVHEMCTAERSVSFYAGRCCLSPKYFARIIMEVFGRKPGDIIKENVILEAKVMLVTNTYTVQQVSDRLNFPNPSFFCKYFRSATGISPRQFQLHGGSMATVRES